VLTYPNDDDAVAFLFANIIEKHGWEWFTGLIAQNPRWVRGTATPGGVLAQVSSEAAISFTTFPLADHENIKSVLPDDNFMSWAQRGAIMASTKMPESAKLFMSWVMGDDYQKNSQAQGSPGTRNTYGAPAMMKAQYADPLAFDKFMGNRQKVEWYKLQFEQQIGTAQGVSPLDDEL
jgi:ABC-type Fe3+ transport system substrate-binding protein